ncbi:MAG TPA: hypothetical protein VFZ42_04720, partial [Chitinophagaceae bacterium]
MFWKTFIVATIIPVFAFSQGGTEILLFDLKADKDGRYTISNGKNITNHKGYDNQPSFHPTKPEILYASAIDTTNVDIKIFNFSTGKTTQFTATPENEFSPTVTPDRKFISCVIQRKNGDQDLAKYPIEGGSEILLIDDLKVGYYAWADSIQLMLYVLADTGNILYYYHTLAKHRTYITKNIKRSLHKIPNEDAISYVEKSGDAFMIRRLPLKQEAAWNITEFPGKDDYCWSGDGSALFTWKNGKLFSFRPGKDTEWQGVTI